MKALISVLLAVVLCVSGLALAEGASEAPFAQWNPDAASLRALTDYVEDVTNPDSPNFIPEVDRIATFDMDGTLIGELAPTYLETMLLEERILRDESYQPDAEMLEFGRMIREHALDKSYPENFDYDFSFHQAKAFAGMTLNEYADFVTRFLVREADGFEGMTYADAYYLPMIEVLEYLHANGFKCYIVSGSDRFVIRTFMEGVADIPFERMIGSDIALEARDQGDTDGIEYVFGANDTLVRTDKLLIKDLKTNKVLQIAQEIGRQPVLSFGNSSGDTSMHNYTLHNNRYKSAAFQLIADDDVRDYGNSDKGPELRKQWEEMGYNVISMRDDWKTIYGEDVVKTGSFHWLETYAENRTPADAGEAQSDNLQYVMYLGTNDKDTDKPVFTQAEAMEKVKEILVRHFSGYTIQEASGGWVGDDGTLYQEYTLVISLSDTNEDAVHAAADELVETFNQSAVLIQANTTRTEFYSGK